MASFIIILYDSYTHSIIFALYLHHEKQATRRIGHKNSRQVEATFSDEIAKATRGSHAPQIYGIFPDSAAKQAKI